MGWKEGLLLELQKSLKEQKKKESLEISSSVILSLFNIQIDLVKSVQSI